MRLCAALFAGVHFLAAIVGAIPPAAAQSIALQEGPVSPVSLGWTPVGTVSPAPVAGWSNEGSSQNGWFISTYFGPGDRHYMWTLDDDEFATISNAGWTLTVIARVDGFGTTGGIVSSVSLTSSKMFEMRFYRSYNTAPYVALATGPELGSLIYFVSADPDGFHRFDLVYVPQEDAAVLLVDGERRLSGYTGYETSIRPGVLRFGLVPAGASGTTIYRRVQLASGFAVPAAPSTWGKVKALYRRDGSR